MLKVNLEDIMADHPIKVKESVSIGDACHLLLRYRINGLLIVSDNDENQLTGVFTTTDALSLLNQTISFGKQRMGALKNISEKAVGIVANKRIITLQKKDKVTKAIALMHKKNVHTIPIYDGNKLVGVVGRHDLINIAMSK